MAFLNPIEIARLGLQSCGANVQISTEARFYNAGNIRLGSHVRIDDYTILSAGESGIDIGDYVHIACFCALIGRERIALENFCGLSSRTVIYSSTDDYSGNYLTNPTVPEKLRNVHSAPVHLGSHVIVGTNATIMPGVSVGKGTAIGAYSMVTKDLPAFVTAVGQPCRVVKPRAKAVLALETQVGSVANSTLRGKED